MTHSPRQNSMVRPEGCTLVVRVLAPQVTRVIGLDPSRAFLDSGLVGRTVWHAYTHNIIPHIYIRLYILECERILRRTRERDAYI